MSMRIDFLAMAPPGAPRMHAKRQALKWFREQSGSAVSGTAPAPVLVEADDVFDGLEERDDCGGPDADGDPLVNDACDVLHSGSCVQGDDPSVRKHQSVNNG